MSSLYLFQKIPFIFIEALISTKGPGLGFLQQLTFPMDGGAQPGEAPEDFAHCNQHFREVRSVIPQNASPHDPTMASLTS